MLTEKICKRTYLNRHAPHNRTPDIPDPRISSESFMYSESFLHLPLQEDSENTLLQELQAFFYYLL